MAHIDNHRLFHTDGMEKTHVVDMVLRVDVGIRVKNNVFTALIHVNVSQVAQTFKGVASGETPDRMRLTQEVRMTIYSKGGQSTLNRCN